MSKEKRNRIVFTKLKKGLICPKEKANSLPLIVNPSKLSPILRNEKDPFKLTLKEKDVHKENYEDISDTTISDDKKSKTNTTDKISIFFEIEKNTVLIQKIFKGYLFRKKYKRKIAMNKNPLLIFYQ